MSEPRGVQERIDWFLSHDPSGSGMCAQHSWHALGGDKGNPPAWGCSDANECVDKVKASGRSWTPSTWNGPPPRGAWVGWKYGNNGHAALSLGDGRIATTDPSDGSPTGIEDLDYPRRWGYGGSGDYTCWTDQYAGVRFEVGDEVGYDYDYTGKPSGTLHVGRDYVYLDIDEWDPPAKGLEHVMTYLNCSAFKFDGDRPGRIRVCFERNTEDSDRFGYQDYVVVPGIPELLITHATYEQGDGTRTWVQMRCMDGLTSMDVGTRYAKRAVIRG